MRRVSPLLLALLAPASAFAQKAETHAKIDSLQKTIETTNVGTTKARSLCCLCDQLRGAEPNGRTARRAAECRTPNAERRGHGVRFAGTIGLRRIVRLGGRKYKHFRRFCKPLASRYSIRGLRFRPNAAFGVHYLASPQISFNSKSKAAQTQGTDKQEITLLV